MNKIYLLIKHSNKIETDDVSIIKASYSIEDLINDFNKINKNYNNQYLLIEESFNYYKYSNKEKTYLIEIYIEEVIID